MPPRKKAVPRRTARAPKRAKKAAPDPAATAAALQEVKGAATIVYVHGIGNKPLASILKAQWDNALFQFDLGERSRMAYWVDRERYPEPLQMLTGDADFSDQSDEAVPSEFSAKSAREPWNPEVEMQRIDVELDDIAGPSAGAAINAKQYARLRNLAAEMLVQNPLADDVRYEEITAQLRGDRGSEARRIQVQRAGAATLRAKVLGFLPRPLRQLITRRITRMFLRDVNDLFVDQKKGERMRDALRERLRSDQGPFVVIAHSQGSMIAYSVLMEDEFKSLDVRLLMTLGSPLGIREVQDFIKDLTKKKKLAVPPNVTKWINVCDPLDPVALDKSLKGEYAPSARKVDVEDIRKFNPDSPRHPHSATGYLALEAVRRPVRDSVDTALFQPVASFKIAKDVVRVLADSAPQERHRVLVELQDFATTELNRSAALARIYETLGAGDAKSGKHAALEPEELQRYVALSLTRYEAELLSGIARGDKKFPVGRIWKNSAKRALLDCSIHTTQAFPAHSSYQARGADIVWAVLDSGIHMTHPHFSEGTIRRVFDCTKKARRRDPAGLKPLTPDELGDAHDFFGHGAHVAGIIAGTHKAVDAEGKERVMCGMAPNARLDIYKVLDDNGGGEDSWIIKALDHIFQTNEAAGEVVIHGVNLSLGGNFDVEAFNCGHTPLCEELHRLWRQGVVVVIAAGNEGFASLSSFEGEEVQANMGMSLGDPANLEDAITVGSVHKDAPHTYGLSFFSSRGPTADGRMKPDCVAPGERIVSVRNDAPRNANTARAASFERLYTEMSGTSMAAPHVSGLVAAFLSKRREFIGHPDRVKKILLDNCTDLSRQPHMQGRGMPNLVKMLVNV